MENEDLPRVVYIAGSGRSGSTLLDILLNNHPLAFGAGELSDFFGVWSSGGRCSCGQPLSKCIFWPKVVERLWTTLPELASLPLGQISSLTKTVESPFSLPNWSRARRTQDRQLYGQLWKAMIVCIGQESGKSIIVDSSKSSRDVSRRILALRKLPGVDLRVIHLVRDPRAVMWSALRGSNRRLEAGQGGTFRGGVYRLLIGWLIANISVHITQAAWAEARVKRIRYEDLVADPDQALRGLGSFLNLEMGSVIDLVANQGPFDPGHGVGGNRMRRQGPLRIMADEEWKEALPAYARRLARLSWPLAHKYGYDLL